MEPRSSAPRVLVVEDETLVAMEVEAELVKSGYDVVGPAGTLEDAERLAQSENLAAAVLDMNLRGRDAQSVVRLLVKRHVPFVVVSGYSNPVLPKDLARVRRLEKPVDPRRVAAAVAGMLAEGRRHGDTIQ
jgi:DNA-binding response OmpR family regulator